jgi:hypothetical protein
MVMRLEAKEGGGATAFQTLVRPVIYLDHWAIRLFGEDLTQQDRLVQALQGVGGTLFFSLQNLFEFTAMTDGRQAEEAETLLGRVIPNLYVADSFIDLGMFLRDGQKHGDEHEKHVMLKMLIKSGEAGPFFSTKGYVSAVVDHADRLAPLFQQMNSSIATKMMELRDDDSMTTKARKYRPGHHTTLEAMLIAEMARDTHIGQGTFSPNDTADWIHAVTAALVGDLVLLDARWRDKLEKATRRIRAAGVQARIAKPFSKSSVNDFLLALEQWK